MARTIAFEGRKVSVPDDATDDEVAHILSAPQPVSQTNPEQPPSTFMGRVKDALIAPESERDPSFLSAVGKGIAGIPGQIVDDFSRSASQVAQNAPEMLNTGEQDISKLNNAAVGTAGGLAGMLFSPLTGAATSLIGRPVEQATGIRRDITGAVASAFVPLGATKNLAKVEKATAALKPGAVEAHAAGYVLPPKMISDKPGLIANTLAGWSGKVKTAQAASAKNQEVTNTLAAKALGLKDDAPLTGDTFKTIRKEAGKAYEAIPAVLPQVKADDDYINAVSTLSRPGAEAAQRVFPNTTKNQGVIDLQDELVSVKDFPTGAGLEIVKELRANGAANLKAAAMHSDPSKKALGYAQRQAADAIDDLIERNVAATGNQDLVKAYKDARIQIAKSYDVEAATNTATGNVNAHKIAAMANKGKPLTGELSTIAKAAQAFPKAMQSAEKFGEVEPLSVLDLTASGVSAAHGNFGVAGALLGRPLARGAVLSETGQNALFNGVRAPDINALSKIPNLRRAPAANALNQLTQQPQN